MTRRCNTRNSDMLQELFLHICETGGFKRKVFCRALGYQLKHVSNLHQSCQSDPEFQRLFTNWLQKLIQLKYSPEQHIYWALESADDKHKTALRKQLKRIFKLQGEPKRPATIEIERIEEALLSEKDDSPEHEQGYYELGKAISDKLSKADMDTLKKAMRVAYLRDHPLYIGKAELEKLTDVFDLIIKLQEKDKISPENLTNLKTLLKLLDRKDIIKIIEQYEEQRDSSSQGIVEDDAFPTCQTTGWAEPNFPSLSAPDDILILGTTEDVERLTNIEEDIREANSDIHFTSIKISDSSQINEDLNEQMGRAKLIFIMMSASLIKMFWELICKMDNFNGALYGKRLLPVITEAKLALPFGMQTLYSLQAYKRNKSYRDALMNLLKEFT